MVATVDQIAARRKVRGIHRQTARRILWMRLRRRGHELRWELGLILAAAVVTYWTLAR